MKPTGNDTLLKEKSLLRARVISQERDIYTVSCDLGEMPAEVSGRYRHAAVTVSDFPAVGDYVLIEAEDGEDHGIITALFPRKNYFMRKAPGTGHQEQVVAANIDYCFICMSLNNDYNLRRLERYLSVAESGGTVPVVVLTKADLCGDTEEKISEVKSIAGDTDVIAVSSYLDEYEEVYRYIKPGMTVAFLGSSGVGKSTLINRLLGEDVIKTQGLRNDDKGRHTTARREVMELPGGAFVIDTPGMRELGMWDSEVGIDATFSDIEELSAMCRFSDCSHSNEPGCAVREAIDSGTLKRERLESYLKLKKENSYVAASESYLEAKERKFKEISKINKKRKHG